MTLPALRMDLDFMPSPVEDHPGLLMRDPFHYSDATLIVPTALVECVALFDGEHTDLDLRELLVRKTGQFEVGEIQESLAEALNAGGFLLNEHFEGLKEARQREFRDAAVRPSANAGAAYPEDPAELRALLAECLGEGAPKLEGLLGVAAPHVSLEGGWRCYAAAYGALDSGYADRTFVILGTSHHGEPNRFGLTRKNFVTPLGEAVCAAALAEELAAAAPQAVLMEDYCHAIEHSIEFQVIFLQHVFGPRIRILPILCGPLGAGIEDGVERFCAALRALQAREGKRLFWVLGIDMAHMGRRYGDMFEAEANCGQMELVAVRDRQRIDRVAAGDVEGFRDLVRGREDEMKWCGASALYTFMKAAPEARAELLGYEQWNIDELSVVTFAALAFRGATG